MTRSPKLKKYIFEILIGLAILLAIEIDFTFLSSESHTLLPIPTKEEQTGDAMTSGHLRQGLELYRRLHHQYPDDLKTVHELVDSLTNDAWGSPITYKSERAGESYTLSSPGKDGKLDTEDDIRYSSETDKVNYPKQNEFPHIFSLIYFSVVLLSYLFCLVILTPWTFLRRVFQVGDTSPTRVYILLMVLMATCPFTWPNLLPMTFGYFRPLKKKTAFLAAGLFILSNISILILIFNFKSLKTV